MTRGCKKCERISNGVSKSSKISSDVKIGSAWRCNLSILKLEGEIIFLK